MRRRVFLKCLFGGAAAMAAGKDAQGLFGSPEGPSHFLLSERGCGRATAYAETNKIVTFKGKTHVAWLDSEEAGFKVRVRTSDRSTAEWSPTYTVGEAHDNHGGPALTVDSQGFLHLAYHPHHHPLRYRRSARPNDASQWDDELQFGERCTYPTLVCAPDGTLILTCRESAEDPWVINLYRKPPGREWHGPHAILRAEHTGYSQFQSALAWGPDRRALHLSCRIYDGKPGRGHTVGYLRSEDCGESWRTASGEIVKLPATAETVDIVAQARGLAGYGFQSGSIAVDPQGTPLVLYSDHDRVPVQAWLATPDESGAWRRRALLPELPPGYADATWGLGMPGGVTVAADGRVFVALTMMKPTEARAATGWGHPSSGILVLESRNAGAAFTARIAAKPDMQTPRWLPSLERPTGHNPVEVPGLMYTEGPPGAGGKDILANKVWWVDLR